MILKDFPYCCTAHIAVGFGETITAETDYYGPKCESAEVAEKWLRQQIRFVKRSHHAMVVVITNNQQHKANDALRKIGFQSSQWMEKRQHAQTKDRLWWADANKFDNNGNLLNPVVIDEA